MFMRVYLLAPFLCSCSHCLSEPYLQYHNLGALVWGEISHFIIPFWLLMYDAACQKQSSRTRSRGVHGSSRGLQNASRTSFKKGSRAIVTVYDASSLFFIHKELGEKYV